MEFIMINRKHFLKQNINIVIVHYNTPYLTSYLVKSIKKYTPSAKIYIFDNSDKYPFETIYDDITIFDNTKGQYIDFNKWLEKYPNRKSSPGAYNNYGSAKHSISIEKCMELLKEDFILLDSDVLLKKDISEIIDSSCIYVGQVMTQGNSTIKRILPFICYINTEMCIEKNIHYFDENMMHGLKYTKNKHNADNYDTGASLYYNSLKFKHKEIKVDDYIAHYGGASWAEKRNKRVPYTKSPCQWIHDNSSLWASKNVIYTCITGNYDTLIEPEKLSEGFDYVCFTNNNDIESKIWEIRPIPQELEYLSNVKQQRCIKINPHKYLPEYNLSIWVDANVSLKKDVNKYIEDNCQDGCVFIGKHPTRDCIYEEQKSVILMKKDTHKNTDEQINRYKKEGFPKHYGLVQSCIVIRRHNDEGCKRLMNCWWKELEKGSHRDQLSFDYARWKNQDVKFKMLDKNIFGCEYFRWNSSHKPFKNKPTKKDDEVKKENVHIILNTPQIYEPPKEKDNKIKAVFIGRRR